MNAAVGNLGRRLTRKSRKGGRRTRKNRKGKGTRRNRKH
jgi:hypothetical protein